jgi:ubiquinone biosynthesis protein Coq4
MVMDVRQQIQQAARWMDAGSIAQAVAGAKRGDHFCRIQLTGLLAWVGYSCPDAACAIYDNIAATWLGSGPAPEVVRGLSEAPLEDSFWDAFWVVVQGPPEGYDALTITIAVASLGAAVHPTFEAIAECHARNHPGAAIAVTSSIPGHTNIDALASCPPQSLGALLYQMIVENGYDPEVLDRESIKLSAMPHALHYLNARILQMHDVWHLVAGYTTHSSNEIAISVFQLAQFGHNYSAMFLAAALAMSTTAEPRGFTILMQIITEAWQHGRATPAMMNIEWESEWGNSLESIRAKYAIPTYKSVFPSDLLESIENPTPWKKLYMLFQLFWYNLQLRRGTLRAAV